MGGIGSGSYSRYGSRCCTDDMRAVDVRWLQREGVLVAGRCTSLSWSRRGEVVASIGLRVEEKRVVLTYRHKSGCEDWMDMSYGVHLDWTDCNYGGKRPWFQCPSCWRRVAVLYGGRIFACRHCHGLAFRSQSESPSDRFGRKADKIREKLGWTPGFLNGREWKPKGMHWRTFSRLCEKHDYYAGRSTSLFMARYKGLAGMEFD